MAFVGIMARYLDLCAVLGCAFFVMRRFVWCWEQCGSGVFCDIGTDFCFYLCSEFGFGRLYSGPFCDAELVDAGSLFLFLLPLLSGF